MKINSDRAVLTVIRHDGLWAVEFGGEMFGQSSEQQVAKAAANRRAREMQDAGRPCLVRVSGEAGYFSGR
jgi:hypothetical protein